MSWQVLASNLAELLARPGVGDAGGNVPDREPDSAAAMAGPKRASPRPSRTPARRPEPLGGVVECGPIRAVRRDGPSLAYASRPDTEIAAHLGEVLWTMGRKDDAARLLKEAAKKYPDNDVLAGAVKKFAP